MNCMHNLFTLRHLVCLFYFVLFILLFGFLSMTLPFTFVKLQSRIFLVGDQTSMYDSGVTLWGEIRF